MGKGLLMAIPREADEVLLIVEQRLTSSLEAVYLHGSAVSGGLRPRSDVDFLVVVNQPMTLAERHNLAADLMRISGHYPNDVKGRRPIELIIFQRAYLSSLTYPARSEFIYGEWLRQDFEKGKIPEYVADPELTLLLAQANQEAVPLLGPTATGLLPKISKPDIRRAIKDVLPVLIKTLEEDKLNVLLTLARMWRTLVTDEFVAKDIAAGWAVDRLPAEHACVLANARETYLGRQEGNWLNNQQELQLTAYFLKNSVLKNL